MGRNMWVWIIGAVFLSILLGALIFLVWWFFVHKAGPPVPASEPTITTQPASTSVVFGDTATLTVVATGATSYQWFFGSSPISGVTTSTLTISNVTNAAAGTYTVVVSNAAGSVTSNPAILTVTASTILTPPTNVSWTIGNQPPSFARTIGSQPPSFARTRDRGYGRVY
jgi:hypothetical protein